jgi:hypothetical protein
MDPEVSGLGREQVHFEQPAQEYTLLDYLHDVEAMADRIRRLEKAIEEAVKVGTTANAGGDPGPASAARNRPDLGGHGWWRS